jgi:hypothetical protein
LNPAREQEAQHNSTAKPRLTNLVGRSTLMKQFKLSKEQIQPLAENYGACIASDKITVDGLPLRFFYRAAPDNDVDSGWRFMSGFESDDYMDDPLRHAVYDVNTIANYDPSIIALLDSPVGSVFEKRDGASDFVRVTDWQIPP